MPVPYTLQLVDGDTKVPLADPIRGEFTDEDWEILSQYLRDAARLRETQLVRSSDPGTTRMEMLGDDTCTVTGLPTSAELSELLHNLRPFVLENERANFAKAKLVVGRREPHPALRSYLKDLRERFDGDRLRERFRFLVGKGPVDGVEPLELVKRGAVVNSDKFLKLWLNGYEYHRVPEMQREFEDLCGAMPFDMARAAFMFCLQDKTKAVLELANALGVMTEVARLERQAEGPPTDSP
ncbi:MAG: hypothetical protein EPO40_17580 [Myxococcaceae bacterium]|nr:MAG: hypothetical protein EPO40_17580 [Myxococcaceae bacterium]